MLALLWCTESVVVQKCVQSIVCVYSKVGVSNNLFDNHVVFGAISKDSGCFVTLPDTTVDDQVHVNVHAGEGPHNEQAVKPQFVDTSVDRDHQDT